jgi:hypothetical protein
MRTHVYSWLERRLFIWTAFAGGGGLAIEIALGHLVRVLSGAWVPGCATPRVGVVTGLKAARSTISVTLRRDVITVDEPPTFAVLAISIVLLAALRCRRAAPATPA